MIIDVSKHNGKIDWEKAKSEIEGAIIRCGYGRDVKNQDDEYFQRNVSECQRLGIPFGVYIYSYAGDVEKAKSEADHVKRLVKGLKLDFPIFYDLEEAKYSKVATKVAETWLSEMKGYDVGIYANLHWWTNYLKGIECKKWVAAWNVSQPNVKNMVLWQYDAYGTVDGVGKGSVDLNKNIALKVVDDQGQNNDSNEKNEKVSDTKMPTIKKGSKGKAVKVWQVIIGADVDGKFGPETDKLTRAFQEKNNLEVDGIVGPKTWKKGLESV